MLGAAWLTIVYCGFMLLLINLKKPNKVETIKEQGITRASDSGPMQRKGPPKWDGPIVASVWCCEKTVEIQILGEVKNPPPRQFQSAILATKNVISYPYYRSTRLNKNVVLKRHGRFRQLMDPRQSDIFGSNSAVVQ